jgi:hypothetical protein
MNELTKILKNGIAGIHPAGGLLLMATDEERTD